MDEAGGNWMGLKDVFGEDTLKKVKCCDFYFKDCRNSHKNKLPEEEEKNRFISLMDRMLYALSITTNGLAFNQLL